MKYVESRVVVRDFDEFISADMAFAIIHAGLVLNLLAPLRPRKAPQGLIRCGLAMVVAATHEGFQWPNLRPSRNSLIYIP